MPIPTFGIGITEPNGSSDDGCVHAVVEAHRAVHGDAGQGPRPHHPHQQHQAKHPHVHVAGRLVGQTVPRVRHDTGGGGIIRGRAVIGRPGGLKNI